MKLLIPIQGVSDIITNSSSELFIVDVDKIDMSRQQFEKVLYAHRDRYLSLGKQSCSGEGGSIIVYSISDSYVKESYSLFGIHTVEQFLHFILTDIDTEKNPHINNIDMSGQTAYYIVDIDWNLTETIKELKEQYNAIPIED